MLGHLFLRSNIIQGVYSCDRLHSISQYKEYTLQYKSRQDGYEGPACESLQSKREEINEEVAMWG